MPERLASCGWQHTLAEQAKVALKHPGIAEVRVRADERIFVTGGWDHRYASDSTGRGRGQEARIRSLAKRCGIELPPASFLQWFSCCLSAGSGSSAGKTQRLWPSSAAIARVCMGWTSAPTWRPWPPAPRIPGWRSGPRSTRPRQQAKRGRRVAIDGGVATATVREESA